MSAILNLPDIRPSLLLDFANSGQVDPRIQCTRASSATCYGQNGVIRTVGANVPRIDFDPLTGQCRGLLVEEMRTNDVKNSEALHVWTTQGVVLTPNASIAPDGTLTATKLVGAANSTNPELHQIERITGYRAAGEIYTCSVFAKAAELSTIRVRAGRADSESVLFDLATGTGVKGASVVSFSAKSVGNGWWRLSVTATATETSTNQYLTISVTGSDGVSGVYIWGAQGEASTSPLSYIKTEATQVTRAADAIQMPLGDWFNPSEGTLFVEGAFAALTTSRQMACFTNGLGGSSLNLISIQTNPSAANRLRANVFSSGVSQVAIGVSSQVLSEGVFSKIALAYANNDFALCKDGGEAILDTEGTVPQVSQLNLGMLEGGVSNIHLKRVAYYPKRLPNEQLQRITAL